nr:RNA-directed DNA polymerase, eukaryota, reverse transcriptase zinc-binding domain protein [Tanacetum cinerariifolium]
MKILNIIRISVDKHFRYGYLKEIVSRRANQKEYIFNEADFKILHLNDIEDMYLLYAQNKPHHLKGHEQTDLVTALRFFIRRIVLKKRVKYVQLGCRVFHQSSTSQSHKSGKMPTKIELALEQSQQSDSNGVLVSMDSTMLTQDDAEDMIREVSNKEIKDAMFDIRDNRALGPNGYSSLFFKKAWSTVGNDVCCAIKEFFDSGQMLGELNTNLITLVPKIQTPIKVSDFRPIACCNLLYKCINKMVNLCFSDDLMIFCNGDPISVGVITDGLNEFNEASGLFPNLNKSTVFFRSIKDAEKEQIKNIMQFNKGILQSKYLGV